MGRDGRIINNPRFAGDINLLQLQAEKLYGQLLKTL